MDYQPLLLSIHDSLYTSHESAIFCISFATFCTVLRYFCAVFCKVLQRFATFCNVSKNNPYFQPKNNDSKSSFECWACLEQSRKARRRTLPQNHFPILPITPIPSLTEAQKKRLMTFPVISPLLLLFLYLLDSLLAVSSYFNNSNSLGYSNAIAMPIVVSFRIFWRSTLTTLPLLTRANCPFSFASTSVRGKFTSTVLPARTGVVIGTVIKTPVLLMLALLPLKNLLASGSQRLTGQDSFVRVSLRCSINVSIV